jgi:hypothetical protein
MESDSAGPSDPLDERLAAAGMTRGELEDRIREEMRRTEPPCSIRHPQAGGRPQPARPRKRHACRWWLRRPTIRPAPGSSWAPARVGCPGHPPRA